MKIKTSESWSQYDVRNLCIKKDWYVRGSCDEYDKCSTMSMSTIIRSQKMSTM